MALINPLKSTTPLSDNDKAKNLKSNLITAAEGTEDTAEDKKQTEEKYFYELMECSLGEMQW